MLWSWRFFAYASNTESVLDEMPDEVKDALLIMLRRQRTLPQTEWKGIIKQLHGQQWRKLYEHLLFVDGVQHRPFGFFGLNQQEYTIVTTATHKQRRYNPPDVFDTAVRRMTNVRLTGDFRREIKLD